MVYFLKAHPCLTLLYLPIANHRHMVMYQIPNDNDNDNIVYLTKNNNAIKYIQYFGLTNYSLVWRLLLRQNMLVLS